MRISIKKKFKFNTLLSADEFIANEIKKIFSKK